MKRAIASLSIASLLFTAVACGGVESEEDEYRNAVPTRQDVSFQVPGGSSSGTSSEGLGQRSQSLLGARAELYKLTYDVSRGLNHSIWIGLNIIESIVARKPGAVQNSSAMWGPWTPALSPITWRLLVTRKGPGQYVYALSARRKASQGAFTTILAGSSTKGQSQYFSGYKGLYTANASALNGLDPVAHPATGKMVAVYDTTGDRRAVKLTLTDYTEKDGGKSNAVYSYLDRLDTSGEFRFAARADLQNNNSKRELLTVTSAWKKSGAGRGDASASGGDLPGAALVKITECWGASFGRVFYKDNYNVRPTEGDAAKCVFTQPLK